MYTVEVIKRKPYPGEKDLQIVLAKVIHESFTEFVTWAMNIYEKGYFWGHYYMEQEAAEKDFEERPYYRNRENKL